MSKDIGGQKNIFVLVLNWNDAPMTMRCAESILQSRLKMDDFRFMILLIDNGSRDESAKQLKLFAEQKNKDRGSTAKNYWVKTIFLPENTGYAGGNNAGIRHALEYSADYILILNNDARIEPDTVEKLVATAEKNREVGIVAPVIVEQNQKNNSKFKTISHGSIRWLQVQLRHIPTSDNKLLAKRYWLKPNEYIPGAAMLVKREVFEKIGLLDENYFLYFEDADFSLRALRAGFSLKIVKNVVAHHQPQTSTRKLGAPVLLYYHYRNALYFNRKLGPWWAKSLLWPWSWWIVTKQLIKLAIGRNAATSKAIIKGVGDFYKGIFNKANFQ